MIALAEWADQPHLDAGDVFGPLVGAHDVEAAVLALLRKWERTYVFEVSRRAGLAPDAIPPVRWWKMSSDPSDVQEDRQPAVVVSAQAGRPITRGGGAGGHAQTWRWELDVGVQAVTRSTRAPENNASQQPRRVALVLATALRSILTQKRDDGHLLGMIDVLAERYVQLSPRLERSVQLVVVSATVEVPSVVEWGRGPGEPYYPPDDLPPGSSPTLPEADPILTPVQKVPADHALAADDPDNELPLARR